jgi:hypothetical protein
VADARRRYPGRLGTRTDGELQQQYVADLDANARTALANLDPTPFFQKYGPTGNAWAIFKARLDAASQQTADPVVAKYSGRLAAADVFTLDSAYVLLESLRVDAGVLGPFGDHPLTPGSGLHQQQEQAHACTSI